MPVAFTYEKSKFDFNPSKNYTFPHELPWTPETKIPRFQMKYALKKAYRGSNPIVESGETPAKVQDIKLTADPKVITVTTAQTVTSTATSPPSQPTELEPAAKVVSSQEIAPRENIQSLFSNINPSNLLSQVGITLAIAGQGLIRSNAILANALRSSADIFSQITTESLDVATNLGRAGVELGISAGRISGIQGLELIRFGADLLSTLSNTNLVPNTTPLRELRGALQNYIITQTNEARETVRNYVEEILVPAIITRLPENINSELRQIANELSRGEGEMAIALRRLVPLIELITHQVESRPSISEPSSSTSVVTYSNTQTQTTIEEITRDLTNLSTSDPRITPENVLSSILLALLSFTMGRMFNRKV